jgi:hypothetical protein
VNAKGVNYLKTALEFIRVYSRDSRAQLFMNLALFVAKGLPRFARELKKPGWFARLFQLS